MAQDHLCLVFGCAQPENNNFGLPEDSGLVFTVENDQQMLTFQQKAPQLKRCVAFIAKKYATGSDIRGDGPSCATIVSEVLPNSEIVRQMIARAHRDLTEQKGVIYTVGTDNDIRPFTQQLVGHSGENFHDGDVNLRAFYSVFKTFKAHENALTKLINDTKGEWMLPSATILEKISAEQMKNKFKKFQMFPKNYEKEND